MCRVYALCPEPNARLPHGYSVALTRYDLPPGMTVGKTYGALAPLALGPPGTLPTG